MSYEHYRSLMPLPYPSAAGSDALACQASAAVLAHAPLSAEAEPSHADQLQQLADLIAANNASCEDDVPLFLRQARRG